MRFRSEEYHLIQSFCVPIGSRIAHHSPSRAHRSILGTQESYRWPMAKTLTDAFVKAVRTPSKARVEHADLRCVGLAFRVTASGVRSWCFRFRDPRTGRSSRIGLGPYPAVSLSAARDLAEAQRRVVAKGKNPVEMWRQQRVE